MTRRTRRIGLFVLAVGVAWVVCRQPPRPLAASGGTRLPDFSLRRCNGSAVQLSSVAGKLGTVLVFTGNDCPNSNKSIPNLTELSRHYGPRGIAFLGVNSNASQAGDAVALHAREHGIAFPVVKDPSNAVADLLGVERTCEVVVLDPRNVVRYHGAIDDQFGVMTVKPNHVRHYLSDALDAILSERPVEVATTRAIGCRIERIKLAAAAPRVRAAPLAIVQALAERERGARPIEVGPVEYSRDIAPIVQRRCQSCHRPDQEAPFSLLTYDDVQARAATIAEVVKERRMPPWHADPRFGHFANDRSLTPRERATLLAWVDQGMPAGDPHNLPPPRSYPPGWTIGMPDVAFAIPRPNVVPAIGVLDYVIVIVPTNFAQDMWIQAAEIRPEVRSIVHHIIVQILDPATGRTDTGDHLATYVPGDAPTIYTPGIAKKIPAGSSLKFGIHYVPDGIAHTDRSQIGLMLAKGPVKHQAFTQAVENHKFTIPPHSDRHKITSTHTVASDLHLYSFAPHMHIRGKDFLYTATYPDGRTETLLSVPAYDFGWQSTYILAEPKAIPRGTKIDCVAHFDNSAGNPVNPDPSQRVDWGEQSYQEMMIGYFDYILDAPIGQ